MKGCIQVEIAFEQMDKSTIQLLKNQVKEENFLSFIHSLQWKQTFHFEESDVPVWFQSVVSYYEFKTEIFKLMDFFEIYYPSWFKFVKMPFEYSTDELTILFANMKKSGEKFTTNFSSFYSLCLSCNGNTFNMIQSPDCFYIPYDFLLRNSNLVTESMECFILTCVADEHPFSEMFYSLPLYQTIPKNMILQLSYHLTSKKSVHFDHFIRTHTFLLKDKSVSDIFLSKISDSVYSPFYYLHYPVNVQKEYIKKYRGLFDTKLKMVLGMDVPNTEKELFFKEICEQDAM